MEGLITLANSCKLQGNPGPHKDTWQNYLPLTSKHDGFCSACICKNSKIKQQFKTLKLFLMKAIFFPFNNKNTSKTLAYRQKNIYFLPSMFKKS